MGAPPATADFDSDTALERREAGLYAATLERHWWADRGPHGGLLAALALRAASLELDDRGRRPCSLTLHYLAPAQEGPLKAHAAVERSGRRVANCLVRLEQDGRPVALALAAFAALSVTASSFDHTRFPEAPAPDALDPLPVHADGVPPFMGNFELRFALGHLPFTGAAEPTCGVWIRTAKPRRPDALAIAVFADAWAPTPYIERRAPVAAPTIDLTVHFRDHAWYERAEGDAFVLGMFRSRLLSDGLFEEDGELWSPDGVLLAQSRQLGLLVE